MKTKTADSDLITYIPGTLGILAGIVSFLPIGFFLNPIGDPSFSANWFVLPGFMTLGLLYALALYKTDKILFPVESPSNISSPFINRIRALVFCLASCTLAIGAFFHFLCRAMVLAKIQGLLVIAALALGVYILLVKRPAGTIIRLLSTILVTAGLISLVFTFFAAITWNSARSFHETLSSVRTGDVNMRMQGLTKLARISHFVTLPDADQRAVLSALSSLASSDSEQSIQIAARSALKKIGSDITVPTAATVATNSQSQNSNLPTEVTQLSNNAVTGSVPSPTFEPSAIFWSFIHGIFYLPILVYNFLGGIVNHNPDAASLFSARSWTLNWTNAFFLQKIAFILGILVFFIVAPIIFKK